MEHPVCFPQAGEIKVDAVKVKRRGHSYHLSDSMLVTSALGGLKKNWFLSVDISKRVEHPEIEVLRTLLELTDKPSTDIVVGKYSPDVVISRNHVIRPEIKTSQRALGEYSVSMNATSPVLSAGETDDVRDTNLNAIKRRKRNRASSSMDEPPHKKHISEHMQEGSVHVNNEENGSTPDKVAEPQSFIGALSHKAHDTSVVENPDNPLKQADVEMNDVDAAKENNQIAAGFTDVNGIVSVFVSGSNSNQGKDNSISGVDNSAYVNHHVSVVSESHRNEVSEAPNDLLAEHHINTNQDKIESDRGEVTGAGKSIDAEKIMEEKSSPKKRKKSSKPKSTSENPKIILGGHSLVESPEIPLGGHSLAETLKPPLCDDSDKPENKEHNISPPQVEGIDVAVEDADVTSHEKQCKGMESSQQNTENAATTADNVEEKKNRNRKKRSTEGKNVHESREEVDEGEYESNADEKERAITAAVNKPEEPRSDAMSLELREQGAVIADNGEKEKQKRRTKKRKEQNVEQAESRPKKGQKNSSQVEGNEIVVNAFEKKSNEENVDESKEQHQEVVDDVKEKVDKRGRKRRSDKNVSQFPDNVEKDEMNHSQTVGKELLGLAGATDDNNRQERVDQIEPVHEAAELKADPDKSEHRDKKSKKRRSSKEKSFGESMHVPEKEEVHRSQVEVQERVLDDKLSPLEQQITEKPGAAGNHEEKVEKKSRHKKSSKEMNLASQEMAGLNSSHYENIPVEKKVGENVEKMEKTRKRRSKVKNVSNQQIKGTHDSSHKENVSIEQWTLDPVEKKSRKRKSSKVKNVPAQESKDVESSHNETLLSENVARATDEANDQMVEVPGSDKINFSDYFLPGQARPDVAASVTASVDEEKNKKSQVDKALSTIETDKITSHLDKELSEVTGNGSEAAAVTAFRDVRSSKVAEISTALGNDVEVSASSTSSLNKPLNTRIAGKSRSSRDQFRVAIRKPSNNNTMVGSESKRSLLAVPGAIFKEDSSGSSKHAEESDQSHSSMRTPSRKLLDYSGSESDANEDTTDDENLSGGIGQISNGKSVLSGDKSMTLNNILRSSSRYKKAKQAAVESQLIDSESQPLDFVPDSQANI